MAAATGRTNEPSIVRIFIHPTRECNLSCSGCYLTDIPGIEDLLQAELPMTYFEDILESASSAGFDELALLVNPQKRSMTHLGLAEVAKELNMKVNMTTTHDVILSMSPRLLSHFDIISMSVDTERFKNPEQAVSFVDRVLTHFEESRWIGHFNINLTYSVEVFDWVKDQSFIKRLDRRSDSITHLMMKPLKDTYGSMERFQELFEEAFELEHLDLTGTKTNHQRAEPCTHHMLGLSQCYAGYEELSIDPNGQLSGCVFDTHDRDVSTVEKFDAFLETWFETRAPVEHCALVQ